jgi:hypothetical protein
MFPQKILKIRLAKNAFAIQHLLHYSIVYTFYIHYRTIKMDVLIKVIAFLTSEVIPTQYMKTFFPLVRIFPLNFAKFIY